MPPGCPDGFGECPGRLGVGDVRGPRGRQGSAPAGSFEERVRTKSSPLVRKIAAEQGVELAAITGSGIAGRVTRKDLDAYLSSRPAAGAAPAVSGAVSGASHAPADSHGPAATPWAGDVVEPMSKIRKLTSDHMAMARRVAAHVTTFWEVDLTRVARVRAAVRKDFEAQSGQKLTYLPFILQAVCQQLKRHPMINTAVRREPDLPQADQPRHCRGPRAHRSHRAGAQARRRTPLTGLTRGVNDLAARAARS